MLQSFKDQQKQLRGFLEGFKVCQLSVHMHDASSLPSTQGCGQAQDVFIVYAG